MGVNIDDLDLKIINQLNEDGRVSMTKLAETVEASRPTVTNRLNRLLNEKIALIKGGLNITKIGYKIADIGLEIRSEDTRREVENFLKQCPRVLDIFRTPEKANIHLRLWGEDDQTINSTIESFRDIQNVDIVYTHYLGTPIHGNIVINIEPFKNEETPCGKICKDCYRYDNEWCLGCPLTNDYKDPLLR